MKKATVTAFFTGLWQLVVAVRAPKTLLGEVARALGGDPSPASEEDRPEFVRHTEEHEQ